MGCNDYNLHLEGSEGNESPTPEYKIYLDGVGVNGYSPTVDIVNENTASFQIQTNDINGSELTSPIPKLSYLQSDYVSNTSLASTLANYSTTSEIASAYLKINGSNATTPFYLPHVAVGDTGINAGKYSGDYYIRIKRSSGVGEPAIQLGYNNVLGQEDHDSSHLKMRQGSGTGLDLSTYSTENDLNSYKPLYINRFLGQNKVYYHGNENTNELATVGDIKNSTITLTQGGVTKGSFTLNQSGNTTIDLDAGGGSITNPLAIGYTDGSVNYNLNLGVNKTTSKIVSSYTITSGGSYFGIPIRLLNGATSPLTLTEDVNGLYGLSLNIDNDTIKVNQDGELYAVGGGGGTTYTAGTGIDITNDTISIDTSVVAQLSDIPDVSNFVTNSSLTTTLQNYVLSSSLATVATSGSYNDLLNKPTIPTNSDYVDLTTDQTVGGTKTFSNDQKFGGYIYLDGSSNAQGVVHKVGNTRKHLVLRNNQASTVYVGNVYDALNLRGSGTRPSYYTNSISKDIALTDDIPDVSNFLEASDITTGSTNGTIAVGSTDIAVKGLGSAAYTPTTDYMTVAGDQVGTDKYITGNKQFHGTVYLTAGKVIVQNNNNTQNIGLINNVSDLQISTYNNKNIKFAPNGTGKLYYGSNEVATVNDIPNISNLADKDLSNLSATGEAHFLKPTITQDVILGDSNTYNITLKAYNSNLDMNVACMQLYNTTNTLFVGNTGTTLDLRGDTTRPQYNGNDLALSGDLTNVADNNLSNVTFTGQTIAVTWGMPKLATTDIWADFEITPSNITFNNGIFVGYYTPNVNGYLFTSATHSGTGGVYLRTGKANNSDTIKGIITFSAALGSGWGTNAWIPLRKGVPAQIWANSLAAQTDIHCFFAPCVGGY